MRIKNHIICLFFSLTIVSANGQQSNYFLKKSKAERLYLNGNYYDAMKIYEELLLTDSLNKELNFFTGVCKFNLKQFKLKSKPFFQKCDANISPDWYFYHASLLHLEGDFENAIMNFNKYKNLDAPKEMTDSEVTRAIESSILAMKFQVSPNKQKIVSLGANINSKYADYSPLITANGKTLYFTSRRIGDESVRDKNGRWYEDIFYVTLENDVWSSPKILPNPINSKFHDACTGIGADGESMLIFRSNDEMKDGKIFSTNFDGEKWITPIALDAELNKKGSFEVSACVSITGNEIYFSSDREGGFGGKDLYRIRKLPNQKWSKAMNLGPMINSAGDEDAPFIHPDDLHLYYSSNGHLGMGGYDVFVAELDSNNFGHKNINLGYPINTTDDDIYFTITGDKTTAYYSSVKMNGFGETDIYKILLEGDDPLKEVYEGKILSNTNKPIESKITLIDKTDSKLSGIYKSNKLTGKFILLILPGHEYELVIEAKDYHANTVNLSEATESQFYLEHK